MTDDKIETKPEKPKQEARGWVRIRTIIPPTLKEKLAHPEAKGFASDATFIRPRCPEDVVEIEAGLERLKTMIRGFLGITEEKQA